MRLMRALLLILLLPSMQSAIRNPQSAIAQTPSPQSQEVISRFNRAFELQRRGAFAEAEAEYRAVLAVAPNYAEAHANLGAVLIRLDRYEEGIKAYETALKLNPKLTPVLLNLGIAHHRNGEFVKAVDAFKRFLAVSPGHVQATQLMGLSLVELGRDQEALEYLERGLSATPEDPALLYAVGLASLRLKKPMVSGAIDALASAPGGLPASYLLRGQSLLMLTQFEKAVVELEAAKKLDPNLPRIDYSLGLGYFKAERKKEARESFEAELRRSPKDLSTLYYLALLDESEGNLDGARKRLAVALTAEPNSADANALLGRILLKQGKAAEALKPLESAVARDPTDSDKHYQLARVYQQLGRRDDAAREFAEVQRLKAEKMDTERSVVLKPK